MNQILHQALTEHKIVIRSKSNWEQFVHIPLSLNINKKIYQLEVNNSADSFLIDYDYLRQYQEWPQLVIVDSQPEKICCDIFADMKISELSLYAPNLLLDGISQVHSLESFRFYSKTEQDISELQNMHNLQELTLQINGIKNIAPLANLENLYILYLFGAIENVEALTDFSCFRERSMMALNLSNNLIQDIRPLQRLRIEQLHLDGNQISDIECISGMLSRNCHEFTVSLKNNPISNTSKIMLLNLFNSYQSPLITIQF